MKISIVVLTHNRLAALRECLIRIQSNTIETDAEVLVVNNGSTDGTREWLDANLQAGPLPVTAIHNDNNLGVCARNFALEIAKGDFILQCDDDVMVHAGWDRILVEPMERDERIGATGPDAYYQEQSWSRTPWSAGLIDDRRKPQVGQHADLLTGWVKAWRNEQTLDLPVTRFQDRKVVGRVHYPRFVYDWDFSPHWGEESDFDMQLRVAGYRLLRVKDCAIHRSLKDWKAAMANVGPTAVKYADEHFQIMRRKWQNDPRLKFEGALVGLR